MAIRLLWPLYALLVSAFLGRTGDVPTTVVGWLWLLLFVAWVASALGVAVNAAWARRLSLACFAPFAIALTLVSLGRVLFVLRNGGMDCATCQGSPLVFLWQWQIELMLLVPGVLLAIWFWRSTRPRVAV